MPRTRLLYYALALLALASCEKRETVTIRGNRPPEDNTVSGPVIENYITKSYISLLARKPDEQEKSAALSVLNRSNVALKDRLEFLGSVMAKPEYTENLYRIARTDLLNSMDTAQISFQIQVLNTELQKPHSPFVKDAMKKEIDRLVLMRDIPAALSSSSISIAEMHRRCVTNYFYDQLNMGSENLVVSLFQNFLFRYPTAEELKSCVRMVNDSSSTAFGIPGSSKEEFLGLFFGTPDYYEGQVRELYRRYLLREPASTEMSSLSLSYRSSGSYKDLQKTLLSTDEYTGIK